MLGTFAARLRQVFKRAEGYSDCQTPTTADETIATSDGFIIEIRRDF